VANTAQRINRGLNAKADVRRLIGTFVSTDGVRGVVDVGGGRIPVDLSGYTPEVDESVWVLFIDSTATVLGPTLQKPGQGTVTAAPANNLVPVSTTAGPFTLPYAAGLSLSAGQIVKLGAWNEGGFVFAVMSTTPAAGNPGGGPGAGTGDQVQVFSAIDSGSYNGSWWTGQVYASDSNTGAWFYGSKIADTIPDTAVIVSVELYLSPVQTEFAGPNIGYHAAGTKPGGSLTIIGATPSSAAGWVALPNYFGDFLKANVGGLGCLHGGFNIYNSLAGDAQSGAVRIHWQA
jgi:hypothetical protein